MILGKDKTLKGVSMTSSSSPRLDPEPVRELFLRPCATYRPGEAARLLGMAEGDVREWMSTGELEGVASTDGLVVPWEELVSFALGFWDQEEVEAALGRELNGAIPELLRLAELRVRIPRMEVVALERVAAAEGRTVDALLSRELLDFMSEHAPWLSEVVEGFGEALVWPMAPE
jgi:hypothetical protein